MSIWDYVKETFSYPLIRVSVRHTRRKLAGCHWRGAASNPIAKGLCVMCQTFQKAAFPVRDAKP
jgi:hypothetical protein